MTNADVDLDEPTQIIRPPLDNRRLWLGTTVVLRVREWAGARSV